MASVHHCPRCELRFNNVAELRDHFDRDHRADPETFRRYRYGQRRRLGEPTKRYLLLANQTLQDEHVFETLQARAGDGRCQVLVLVPATPSANLASPPSTAGSDPGSRTSGSTDDVGLAIARWRLRTMIDRLAELDIEAEGRIGHPDPYRAVADLLSEEDIDEIIVSTLPPRISRWLKADLPKRLARHGIPVTTLTATP
jgi:hypothetical protein